MWGIIDILWYVTLFLLLFVVIPASLGREFGIRRLYIQLLMNTFAWGANRIKTEEKKRNVHLQASNEIIEKQNSINRIGSLGDCKNEVHKDWQLESVCYLVKSGIEAVIDDEVTKRFNAEELPSWNLLTRSNFNYQYISLRLTFLWFVGLVLRYFVLLPLRVLVTFFTLSSLALCASLVAQLPDWKAKRQLVYNMNVVAFRMMCRGISAIITYHDSENMPRSGGICVANHTTVIDAVVLMQHRPYAILGQKHSGFLGWCMDTISKSAKHVWFERSESSDRKFVAKRMMEHVSDDKNYPILLFPEGTCINNTSVMMFKKGSFELPTTIYPVAIKYNPWFGDAYWNSSKHSMLQYLFKVMTSWALVADVWYLPAMNRNPDEDAIHFADRVKQAIARKGGLVDSVWDGQLKRARVKKQDVEKKQKQLGHILNLHLDEDFLSMEKPTLNEEDQKVDEEAPSSQTVEDIQDSGAKIDSVEPETDEITSEDHVPSSGEEDEGLILNSEPSVDDLNLSAAKQEGLIVS